MFATGWIDKCLANENPANLNCMRPRMDANIADYAVTDGDRRLLGAEPAQVKVTSNMCKITNRRGVDTSIFPDDAAHESIHTIREPGAGCCAIVIVSNGNWCRFACTQRIASPFAGLRGSRITGSQTMIAINR